MNAVMQTADETAYLCVDHYLQTLHQGVALQAAFNYQLIDALLDQGPLSFTVLLKNFPGDSAALGFLLGMLKQGGVINGDAAGYRLTYDFIQSLEYQDLLEAKLAFASRVASDFADHFSLLLTNPDEFFQQSRLFELFDYSRAYEHSAANYSHTKCWMDITSALTRYESLACLKHYDFSRHQEMLDIGGNSGEFVMQICRRHPQLRATVLDLPVVCEVGRAHVREAPEAERIRFIEVGSDIAPERYDLVSFKSMLHDWPADRVADFIGQAFMALKPGGVLLIYERGHFDPLRSDMGYGNLPLLLFFRSYRGAGLYREIISRLGMAEASVISLQLEMPFILLTVQKPSAG